MLQTQEYERGYYDAYLGLPEGSGGLCYMLGYSHAQREIRRGNCLVLSCALGIVAMLAVSFLYMWVK